jgi:hypothetical protein
MTLRMRGGSAPKLRTEVSAEEAAMSPDWTTAAKMAEQRLRELLFIDSVVAAMPPRSLARHALNVSHLLITLINLTKYLGGNYYT